MTKKLEVKGVNKTFFTELGKLKVLEDISFDLYEGEIISILGPSGSGKSTLLNNIAGLLEVDSGDIINNGKLGYMFQKDHLLNWRTVWKNVVLGLEINKSINEENEKYIIDLLEKYHLKVLADLYAAQGKTMEAKQYLLSLQNNYSGDDDIAGMISERLERFTTEQ